eukprot:COSAG01_NODE_1070_length_11869_cov_21.371368_10_plen_66_part_00
MHRLKRPIAFKLLAVFGPVAAAAQSMQAAAAMQGGQQESDARRVARSEERCVGCWLLVVLVDANA